MKITFLLIISFLASIQCFYQQRYNRGYGYGRGFGDRSPRRDRYYPYQDYDDEPYYNRGYGGRRPAYFSSAASDKIIKPKSEKSQPARMVAGRARLLLPDPVPEKPVEQPPPPPPPQNQGDFLSQMQQGTGKPHQDANIPNAHDGLLGDLPPRGGQDLPISEFGRNVDPFFERAIQQEREKLAWIRDAMKFEVDRHSGRDNRLTGLQPGGAGSGYPGSYGQDFHEKEEMFDPDLISLLRQYDDQNGPPSNRQRGNDFEYWD